MEKLYINDALNNNYPVTLINGCDENNISILQEYSSWYIESFHDQLRDWLRSKINYYFATLNQKFNINTTLICTSDNIISKFYLIQSINPNIEQFENILHLCIYNSLTNIISKKNYCLCFNLDIQLFELFERLYLFHQVHQPIPKSDTNYSNRRFKRITYKCL